ncbi:MULTISPECIES: SRPBCC family protein [Flammeovirga]|uniref:START domain-containing protein n=1 Tax=Flammeovirga agarivorans TaxID=2726742 RepID=A0A7X8XXT6_9BACT|nr:MULTISPECIES: hypothetical protein [Flammeovirga]NLR93542.1 hypothetical protein [Flammeovirga agarivorans]
MIFSRYIIVSILLSISLLTNAQDAQWNTETTEEGSITVTSRVFTTKVDGKNRQIVEYKASTITDIESEKILALLKDASTHKNFSKDTEESKKLKDLPNGEWLVYYFIDAPFPIPNNDLIVTMKEVQREDSTELIGWSTPNAHEKGDVKRMVHYNLKYIITKLENGQSELIMDVSMTPVTKAPDFLVKTWLPAGPSDMIVNILKEAEDYK